MGKIEKGELYEDTPGSYVHAAFVVYITTVTLGNYLSNKIFSMACFDITVLLGLLEKIMVNGELPGKVG